MSKITISEFNGDTTEEIISLILNIQQQEFNINITRENQPDLESIQSVYQSNKGNFWIAKYNGEVIGTIALLDIGNNFLAVRKMFVKKEFRSTTYKVAQQLLETALLWAKNHNIINIYLGTTDKFLAAQRFYEKNRFIKISKSDLPKEFPIMQVDSIFYSYIV